MTRSRSPAQRAPQSKEAAIELLEQYAQSSASLAIINANRESALASTNAVADLLAAPLVAEMKEIVKQLKPWWASSFEELTAGKRKSIDLGGCTIGYRINPPSVGHSHGTDADAVIVLQASAYSEQLVRVGYSLDKPAILKLLDAQAAAAAISAAAVGPGASPAAVDDEDTEPSPKPLADLGFSIKQPEIFFIDAIAPSSGDPTTSLPVGQTPA